MSSIPTTWENWGRCAQFTGRVVLPRTVDEICDIVRSSRRVHVVGAGHSFSYPAGPPSGAEDNGLVLLDLTQTMNRVLGVEQQDLETKAASEHKASGLKDDGWICELEAGCTVGKLSLELEEHGLALENSVSIMAVTLVGAVLTGSHGSGVAKAVLADLVVSMTVVTGTSEVREVHDPRLFINLGMLGVVTKLRVRCVPFYHVSQRVYEGLRLDDFLENTRRLATLAESVSFWADLCGGNVIAWLRDRASDDSAAAHPELHLLGGKLCLEPLKVVEAERPILTTATGAWYDLLAFFRPGETLPNRASVQAEFFVPFSSLPDALRALRKLPNLQKLLPQGSEIRVARTDSFALSPCHGRFAADEPLVACIHFTFANDPATVPRVVAAVEAALRPFGARPRWGKLFSLSGRLVERLYSSAAHPDCALFWAEVRRWDPDAKLRNALFDQIVRRQAPEPAVESAPPQLHGFPKTAPWFPWALTATAVLTLGLAVVCARGQRGDLLRKR